MKRFIAVAVFLLSIPATHLFAQEQVIELSFKADSKGTTVVMDSVFIENLSQETDTSLFVNDTVLHFEIVTSVPQYNHPGAFPLLISVFPNPIVQTARLEFNFPVKQKASLLILNLLGQQLTKYTGIFSAGTHKFLFSPGRDSYYIIWIKGEINSGSARIINLSQNSDVCKLEALTANRKMEKSSDIYPVAGFPISLGDKLRFTCYAKTTEGYSGSDYVEDSLVSNENYSFSINPGIPCRGIPYFHYGGKTYHTLQYGPQCWLKENLYFIYPDAWCYDDNVLNCDEYGYLYTWTSAMEACPPGWHLPSDMEWYDLVNYISGPSGAGGKMKETDTTHWLPPNYTTNSSGFTALPGGHYTSVPGVDPYFSQIRKNGYFWTSTEDAAQNIWAWRWFMDYAFEGVNRNRDDKRNANSVRCMRNLDK